MQKLGINYTISVDDVLPMNESNVINGWKVKELVFYSVKRFKPIKMSFLINGVPIGSVGCKRIFKMKDVGFILEVESEDGEEYFYSEKLEDLL